jgi:hypothetical protein
VRRPVAVAAALLISGAATAYAASPMHTGATIAVSPTTQGVRAAVKLNVRHTFYCGRPKPATIAVKFPAAEHVPSSIPVGAVHLSAGRVKALHVSGKTVFISVRPPPLKGMTCMVIVLGKLRVKFDKAAGLGNPSKAGTYAVSVTDGRFHYTGHFTIAS